MREIKTRVPGTAVLRAADVLGRAGHSMGEWISSLGQTRASLLAGGDVEWDLYASSVGAAVAALGASALAHRAWEMYPVRSDAVDAVDPPSGRTQRDCIRALATEVIPATWPFVASLADLTQGFASLTIEIPAPLCAPPGFFAANVEVIERFPRDLGAGAARVLDLHVSPGARRGTYLLELRDEHVRLPLGPLGDGIAGPGVLPMLDMGEIAGLNTAAWLAEHRIDRSALMGGAPLSWELYRALVEAIVDEVGLDGLTRVTSHFAEVTRALGESYRELGDVRSAYHGLHEDFLTRFWGPLQPGFVVSMPWGRIAIRLSLRAGLEGSHGLLASHAATLESIARHFGPTSARAVTTHVDDGATGATYLVELPDWACEASDGHEPSRRTMWDRPSPAQLRSFVDDSLRAQRSARASVIEQLGQRLAQTSDVQSVADVVIDAMFATIALTGMEIDVASAEGELVPMRARGLRSGRAITRELVHAGERMGRIGLWASPSLTGETVAALDLVAPWVAVAFGTALLLGRERRARLRAEEEATGAREILADVLLSHPRAVYVIGSDGIIEPANEKARRGLEQNAAAIRALVAEAAGTPANPKYDVLPVRVAGRLERVLVIDFGSEPSHGSRLALAIERWGLSVRQGEILDCLCRGMTNKEIAQSLACAEVTVENHLTAIYRRSGLESRTRVVSEVARLE